MQIAAAIVASFEVHLMACSLLLFATWSGRGGSMKRRSPGDRQAVHLGMTLDGYMKTHH
jgi:hypothetical protein